MFSREAPRRNLKKKKVSKTKKKQKNKRKYENPRPLTYPFSRRSIQTKCQTSRRKCPSGEASRQSLKKKRLVKLKKKKEQKGNKKR